MTTSDLYRLLRTNNFQETEQLEFKREFPKNAADLCKSFAAFANGNGGIYLIGVEDKDGDVVGIKNPDDTLQRLTSALRDSIRPSIHPELGSIEIGGGSYVVWANVPAYSSVHFCNEKIYTRVGPTTRAVIDEQALLRVMSRGAAQSSGELSARPASTPPASVSQTAEQLKAVESAPYMPLAPVLPVEHIHHELPPFSTLQTAERLNNLPQSFTSFIGRGNEVADIKALLEKTRLLTLTGPGGSGKTRLSLRVAADMLAGYGDGIWLVELAPLSDPTLVPQVVADALGVREEVGRPIVKTLINTIKTKHVLIILDNCEHLIEDCAVLVTDLLRACTNIHILSTSHEPLNVVGEQTYRVPSLALPDPKTSYTVESLSAYEAIILFIERAQSVQPSFAMTDQNADVVAQVCWRLDGIPLAIELAAAQVRAMTVEQIMARLDDRFRLLKGKARTSLPHHQTLRALMDWSFDLLDPDEKVTLLRLSVFAGGWTLAAAEAVCKDSNIAAEGVCEILMSLLDKSFVLFSENGGGRYSLLETVRQYAAARLKESLTDNGLSLPSTQAHHAAWHLAFAELAEPHLTEAEQGAWLCRLEAEHDNLRLALSWYEANYKVEDEETQFPPENVRGVEDGLRLAGALWRFWYIRGFLNEGDHWLTTMLSKPGRVLPLTKARALHGASIIRSDQGDYEKAKYLAEESVAIYHEVGDKIGVATALIVLGDVARNQGDLGRAKVIYEQSLSSSKDANNLGAAAKSKIGLGIVARGEGDLEGARLLFEDSLSMSRGTGNKRGIAYALNLLGLVVKDQGDLVNAWSFLQESLKLRREVSDKQATAYALESIASIAAGQGRDKFAGTMWGAAESLREFLGAPLPLGESDRHNLEVQELRRKLDATEFEKAWDAGRRLTPDQAIEQALTTED